MSELDAEIPDDVFYVVVGTRIRFRHWCMEKGWHPDNPALRNVVRHVGSDRDIQWLRGYGEGKRWVIVEVFDPRDAFAWDPIVGELHLLERLMNDRLEAEVR